MWYRLERAIQFGNTKIRVELEVKMVLSSDPANYCRKLLISSSLRTKG